MIDKLLLDIYYGITGLISVINPFAIVFIFLAHTNLLSKEKQKILAKHISINTFFILSSVFFAGTAILHFFNISINALRIGGGLVVAINGWQILNSPYSSISKESQYTDNKDYLKISSKSFFPLTVPLTTGPGAISTIISLSIDRMYTIFDCFIFVLSSLITSLVISIIVYFTYSRSYLFYDFFGSEKMNVALRISAFILLCIGIQIILNGIQNFFV